MKLRYEVATALNILEYIRVREETGKADNFITHIFARELFLKIKLFLSGYDDAFYRKQFESIIVRAKRLNLPYSMENACYDKGNYAVEYSKRLYLFETSKTSGQRAYLDQVHKQLTGMEIKKFSFDEYKFSIYTFDVSFRNISILKMNGYSVISKHKRFSELIDIDTKELSPNLFPYQVEGVKMLCSGYRLLADSQGLGKTAQTLQFIQYEGIRPVLICCPATLKLNWKREILMWTNTPEHKITIIEGTKPQVVRNRFVIINYDLLPYWVDVLSTGGFELVVCDECQYIQSPEAQRTKAFLSIAKHIKDRLFISGTPFTSRPYQMFTALHLLEPKIFNNAYQYGTTFCKPSYFRGKVNFSGASNTEMLHEILSDGICIRRLKEDVLEELPDKMRLTVPIGMSKTEVEGSSVEKPIRVLEKQIREAKDPLATLEYQKQIAFLRKKDLVIQWIRDFLDTGKKLVVFGVHKNTLDIIENTFPNISVRIDGSTPNKQRDANVQKFQKDPNCRLFIGNVQAAGTGITLTAASDSVFVEFPWTASACLQAEDRIHRIGAKNACTIYYMAVPDTIDEQIIRLINSKAKMHTAIFDETSDNMLEDLRKADLKYKPLFTDTL